MTTIEDVMRHVRRLQVHINEWTYWYAHADVLVRHQLPPPPSGTSRILEDLDKAISLAPREELDITDKLLADRERVLRAIPECPEHGAGCVPHALEWIALQRKR